MAEREQVKVGDYFYTSWGYDQTQVDFYEVVGFSPSGKSIRLCPIGKRDVATADNMHAAMVPDNIRRVGDNITVRRRDWTTSVLINGHHASLWDGKPKYQTGHGYGH